VVEVNPDIPADATTKAYDDGGNNTGVGGTANTTFGAVVDLAWALTSSGRHLRLAGDIKLGEQQTMRKIRVSSLLPVSFRGELERIVFFNREQDLVTEPLVDSVHRYGVPSIVEEDGYLRFCVNAYGQLQSLYVLDETAAPAQLVGVAMFFRENSASVAVLHLAVHEDYTSRGQWAEVGAVALLIANIRGACMRTHGIEILRILYPHAIKLDLRPSRTELSAPTSTTARPGRATNHPIVRPPRDVRRQQLRAFANETARVPSPSALRASTSPGGRRAR
jgi:hypothetical protein